MAPKHGINLYLNQTSEKPICLPPWNDKDSAEYDLYSLVFPIPYDRATRPSIPIKTEM
jgi:hypothetical protein